MMAPDPGPLRFSPQEMRRRADALDSAAAEAGARHCIVYGANRSGSGIQWLTGWPVTREAVAVHTSGVQDVLLVNFYNHVPQARLLAVDADVRWAGASTAESTIAELEHRGATRGSVAVVGALPFGLYARLVDAFGPVADLGPAYTRLRTRKSDEELERLRQASRLTDASCVALRDGTRIGSSEHALVALVEASYRSAGGANHIHYFSLTSMAGPQQSVPAQWPTGRVVARGDVLACELSTSVAVDYPGQLLRTFTVADDPTPLVQELHDVADEALTRVERVLAPGVLPAQVVGAADVIEDAGFTTIDDLVHGLGGGYLPPVFGSRSRTLTPVPDTPFEAGMTVVVQPNVVTPDRTLGVQTGEMFEITETGCRSLHAFPRGLGRITG